MWKRNRRRDLLVFVLALLIRSSSTTLSSSDFSTIIYLGFNTTVPTPLPPSKPQTVLAAVHADDSPFTRLKLPWAFNFFGNQIRNIFVDPNGALHQTSVPSSGPAGNIFNTSYFGVIAGYLADLNPSVSTRTCNITSYITGDRVTIIFTAVPLYIKTLNVSFRISLFNDSRVEIDYDYVRNLDSHGNATLWLTGLRGPQYDNHASQSNQQRITGLRSWNTKVKGIYPERASVKDGSQFIACPISKVWGAYPTTLNATSKSLTVSPLSFSCVKYLDIGISFALAPDMTKGFAKCVIQPGSTAPALRCNLSMLPTPAVGVYQGRIGWRVLGSGKSYSFMAVAPIPLTVVGAVSTPDYTLNTALPTGCTAKGLLTGNLTCLHLPCDKAIPILYKNNICNISAPSALGYDTCSSDLAYNRDKNICCTIEQLDCAGVCNGKTKVGLLKLAPSTQVCCIGKIVDCFGVCDGGAVLDTCGVCGGRNKKGRGCNTGVSVDTAYGNNILFASIDYSKPRHLWALSYVNISNQNSISITVNITNTGHTDLGPQINFKSYTLEVPPFTTKNVTVNVSAIGLYTNANVNWEVKVLNFDYYKKFSDTKYSYPISVYVGAQNCSTIQDVGACMRLPACMLCSSYPTLRILKETDVPQRDEGEDEDKESEEWVGAGGEEERLYYSQQKHRQLFAGLIPLAVGLTTDPPLSGSCVNGFSTAICSSVSYNAAPSLHPIPALLALTTLISLYFSLF